MSVTDRYSVTTTPPDAIHPVAGPREVLDHLRDRLADVEGEAVSWSVIDWSTGRRFGGEVDGSFGDRGLQEHLADVQTYLDDLLWDLIGPYPLWFGQPPATDPGPALGLRARVHVDVNGLYLLDIRDVAYRLVKRIKRRYRGHPYVDVDDLQRVFVWFGYALTGPWVLWAAVLPLSAVEPGTPPGTSPPSDPAGPRPQHVRAGQVDSPLSDLSYMDEHLRVRGLQRVDGWYADADVRPAIDWMDCVPDPTLN